MNESLIDEHIQNVELNSDWQVFDILDIQMSLALAAVALLAAIYMERLPFLTSAKSRKQLNGPKSPSWWFGHELQLSRQEQVGDLEFAWMKQYGTAWATKGCFGRNLITLTDPLGLQHVLRTSGYNYPKSVELTQTMRILVDEGISWSSGDTHVRQRKVMNPIFSGPQIKSYKPIIEKLTHELTATLTRMVLAVPGQECDVEIPQWLYRTALDIVGEASFDYQFHALSGKKPADDQKTSIINSKGNELMEIMHNLFSATHLHPPGLALLIRATWPFLPQGILDKITLNAPTEEVRRWTQFTTLCKELGKELLNSHQGRCHQSKDALSVLVASNEVEDPRRKLSENEILSQVANLVLGGYETAASTLSWLLFEISKYPEQQQRIREEFRRTLAQNNGELSVNDYDQMEYLNAVIKEALRFHPIVPSVSRVSAKDDVIPLASPVSTVDGTRIREIPIKKGQEIVISMCGYNREPSVWGPDAHEWNPERWLNREEDKIKVGIYANVLTFSAGVRGCIGWRLGLLELQVQLAWIMDAFEFSPSRENIEIIRAPAKTMLPMGRGRESEGERMPLHIRLAPGKST